MALGILAVLRLAQLQLFKYDYYSVLAETSHQRKYEINPVRGEIFVQDRGQKVPLVLNRHLKTLYADTRYVQDPTDTAKQLAELTHESAAGYEQELRKSSAYIVLKKQVEPELAKAIDGLQLAGIGLSDEDVRSYPEGTLAAQVLGFVNAEGQGQYGIEEYFNSQLSGEPGLLNAKTDIRGIPIATSDNVEVPAKNGSDLVLTIDRNIQAKVESVLKSGMEKYHGKRAAAVVMEANTGAIKAMASYPTYEPARYQDVTDYRLFTNLPVQNTFEPGSNFKIFTMSTGLDMGAVTPDSTYLDTGSIKVDEYTIKNAGGIPSGTHSMKEVIEKSINTGAVQVLKQLGGGEINETAKQKLYEYFSEHFGFGKLTGIELAGEAAGNLNKADNSDVNYANMTFGQGLTATMLQVVTAVTAVVNGGTLYQPYIVQQQVDTDGNIISTTPKINRQNIISQQTSAQLKEMMELVVQYGGGYGTKIEGYRIGGKTGTAQIPDPNGGYFEYRDIGSFTGFATTDNARYVMMVRIDEPVVPGFAGSAAAGPMFGDIMRWLINYTGIPPSS